MKINQIRIYFFQCLFSFLFTTRFCKEQSPLSSKRSQLFKSVCFVLSFCGGSDSKESAYVAEDLSLISRLGRSPGGGHDNPLQYSCLGNSMDKETLWTTVHGATKNWTRLSNYTQNSKSWFSGQPRIGDCLTKHQLDLFCLRPRMRKRFLRYRHDTSSGCDSELPVICTGNKKLQIVGHPKQAVYHTNCQPV